MISFVQMDRDFALLKELHSLRKVEREITKPIETDIPNANNLNSRNPNKENDAEHTCMMALTAMVLDDYIPAEVDRATLLRMILIHDTPEIYAGDVWYLADKTNKHAHELLACEKLFANHPKLKNLWLQYEDRQSPEAIYTKYLDIIQAVTSLIINKGADWKRNGITQEREMAFSEFIHSQNIPLGVFLKRMFDEAIEGDFFAPAGTT